MPGFSSVLSMLKSFISGSRLVDGGDCKLLANMTASGKGGLVATPGGGQAGALVLPAYINRVETVASAGDSVALPPALSGLEVQVINATVTSLNVFPNPNNPYTGASDTAATAASSTQNATAHAVAGNATAIFVCPVTGQWKQTQ